MLLDLRMPGRDGIGTLEAMAERGLDTPTLVLTTFDDPELVIRALRAGARGYLREDVTLEQLVSGVRTVAEGTVKNHVSSILLKLSARDRTHAVLRALHLGLLSDDGGA